VAITSPDGSAAADGGEAEAVVGNEDIENAVAVDICDGGVGFDDLFAHATAPQARPRGQVEDGQVAGRCADDDLAQAGGVEIGDGGAAVVVVLGPVFPERGAASAVDRVYVLAVPAEDDDVEHAVAVQISDGRHRGHPVAGTDLVFVHDLAIRAAKNYEV